MLMLARSVAVLAFGALYSYAQEEASPKSVHPRATPDDYAARQRRHAYLNRSARRV